MRYLSGRDVARLLPPIDEQIKLVREGYAAVADGRADMPAVPFLRPREDGFLRAMPAYLADRDVVAVKWIGGHDRNRERGLPYLSGLIIVNDPETMLPTAVVDCGAITAARTAAASALCVDELAPVGWTTAAIIGFGVQGRAHAEVLRHLNPEARIRVATRRPPEDPGEVEVASGVAEAVDGADIVITAIPMGGEPEESLAAAVSSNALVLPIDFDAAVPAGLVTSASLFLVDDLDGFTAARAEGSFVGWPEPHGTIGSLTSEMRTRGSLRVCCNLGVGSLDALFGAAVADAAVEAGIGVMLDG